MLPFSEVLSKQISRWGPNGAKRAVRMYNTFEVPVSLAMNNGTNSLTPKEKKKGSDEVRLEEMDVLQLRYDKVGDGRLLTNVSTAVLDECVRLYSIDTNRGTINE
jgi:hypothetical protein